MSSADFQTVQRQQFRRFFQPSRILLGLVPAPTASKFNVITLCFSMHCSYQPPMLAIAINDQSSTYGLIQETTEFVLSVPGPSLVDESMYCGVQSMRDVDKIKELALDLVESHKVSVPGLGQAIANVELRKASAVKCGDHIVVIGEVLRFAVNAGSSELPLLSIGPVTEGYEVLRKKGIHRLGVVARS